MRTRRMFQGWNAALTGAVVLLASLALATAVFAQADTQVRRGNLGNPRVFPPQAKPHGLSYADWTVRWWQWAYGLPVAGHPLFDETGADCGAGQTGNVWFLGGVFNVSGSAVRDLCVVPTGKSIFFPILNVEWDNVCPPGTLTPEELRATATWYMDLATDLECEVDGFTVQNVAAYRFAGDPFAATMPEGNIFQYFGCPTPAGAYGPMVPDGMYLMLSPLPPGPHTIHFKGTVGDPINFTLEITYRLTVSPTAMTAGDESASSAANDGSVPLASASSRTSWGRIKTIYR